MVHFPRELRPPHRAWDALSGGGRIGRSPGRACRPPATSSVRSRSPLRASRWGLDNNLTRKVSLADPLQIVEPKGLDCRAPSIWFAASRSAAAIAGHLGRHRGRVLGFLGYGASLALFVMALRHLGTARTGAYFSTAPFLGTAPRWSLLGEPITALLAIAGALMAVGVWLHLTEHHEHGHVHEAMAHAHPHVHDEHHRHAHNALVSTRRAAYSFPRARSDAALTSARAGHAPCPSP